jgi:hypothetical protein
MTAPMTAPPVAAPPTPAAPPVDAAEAARRASAVSMALHGTLGPEQPAAAPAAPQTPQAAAVSQALGRGAQIGATAPVQAYAANQAQQPYTWADKQRQADASGTASLMGAINTSTDNYLKQIAAAQPMDQRRTDALVRQAELDFQDKSAERGVRKKELEVRNKQADVALATAAETAGLKPIPVDIATKQSGVKPEELKAWMGTPEYGTILDQTILMQGKGYSQAEYNAAIDQMIGKPWLLRDENGKPLLDSQGNEQTNAGLPQGVGDFLKIRYGSTMDQYNAAGTGVVPPSERPPVSAVPTGVSNLSKPQQQTLIAAARAGVVLPPQVFQDASVEQKIAAVLAANKRKNGPK